MSKILRLLPIIGVIFLFLFLRFYNIKNSLFFFNDNGRDFLVLQQWQQTGKPPLLGPQNSALPINQSAIYFYLLYPAFLLTNRSPLSPLLINAFLYIASLIICLLLAKNNSKLQKILLVSFFFISIHPQYLSQNRYIWNPSFVTPFLVIAFTSIYLLKEKVTALRLWLTTFSLAAAVSFSYSITPVLVGATIYYLIFIRKKTFYFISTLLISLLVLNAPTIFFELHHHFLLTTSLFTKPLLAQSDSTLPLKFRNLVTFIIGSSSLIINLIVFIGLTICIIITQKHSANKTFLILFLFTLILTLIAPFTIQAHYIFGIAVLFFFGLSFLPNLILIPLLVLSSFFFFNPNNLQTFFKSAPRTYDQMASCFNQLCQKETEPLFVTVQSNLHPYHVGPEHRYLMKKLGCNVKEIEKDTQAAKSMAVVVDGGDYQHGQTSYYELTLFGPSQVAQTYFCQPNFKVVILQKTLKKP